MTLRELKQQIGAAAAEILGTDPGSYEFEVEYSKDPKFGDFACNAAMVYAKHLGRSPRDLADELAKKIAGIDGVAGVDVAGPGFLNITMSDQSIAESAKKAPTLKPKTYENQIVVTEFSDPNPFKVLHVGHLYTSVVGDAITNLIAAAGGQVHRVNFGGDVGRHVGQTMWAIINDLGGENPEKLDEIAKDQRSEWMAACYVKGTQAYEDDAGAKQRIIELNKAVYRIHEEADHESALARIYWTCRTWSYEYFEAFYRRIGTKFEKYYPESETAPIGLKTVREQLKKGIFKESKGAVVFEGEPYGLHTRVFITSEGLPTYEAKDVGLLMTKWRDYHFDRSVVITGNDITEYMKVVLKSVELFATDLAERSLHIPHGNVKLAGGMKMSSRRGNFLRAGDVLDLAAEANKAANGHDDEKVVLGAVKYAFLKQRIGADLIYLPEESVSLEGNSGPYLQYAHARARSILAKAEKRGVVEITQLQPGERLLAKKIGEYTDVLARAVDELMPHHICVYMYELAQVFNRFYENYRVVGDVREAERTQLVGSYADVLADGLSLMGIAAPNRL